MEVVSRKLVDYHTTCKVLGVEFDLKMSGDGLALVYNTDEKIDELCDCLDAVIDSRSLRKSDGERLRGRLQFACGQLFGRAARNHIRILSNHFNSSKNRLCDDTVLALNLIRDQIRSNIPRRLVVSLADHIHIYVDASFDETSTQELVGSCTTAAASLLLSLARARTAISFLLWKLGVRKT